MIYTASYASPLGGIVLAADELGLTGLWFTGAKYFGAGLPASAAKAETPILAETRRWLDIYFAGQCPAVLPPLHPSGSPFRRAVWDILLPIPYGETTTYGAIAQQLAAQRGLEHLSAQAVGGAAGHAHVSEARLARTVDDAAHDRDLERFVDRRETTRDLICDGDEVDLTTAARGT